MSLACFIAPPACATIHYDVSLAHPEQHLFHITMIVPDVKGELIVQMPAWNALYAIRDFASHLRRVDAFLEGDNPGLSRRELPIEKLDKQTWRIRGTGAVHIEYETYWDEPGPFGTQLNLEHAFINPAMVLMYVPDRRSEGVNLSFRDLPSIWQVSSSSSTMTMTIGRSSATTITAATYDQLADSPIETGKFTGFALPVVGAPITVVIHGDNWHRVRMEDELTRICKYELQLMGGAPFERYTFIFHIGHAAAGAGGGMEHANSTAINIPSDEFLPDVAAHEFFHLWNVKRIRPASLEPVDYTKEQYTRALWFAEGVTSTYSSYTLERTGIWTKQQLYDQLGNIVAELERRPANKWQSAEESSLDAWFEKYPLYDEPDYSVSYYTKGEILGVLLDLLIRDRTNNTKSLDDVMRAMNTDFAKAGKTYRDSLDIRLEAEKIASGSFEEFFAKYVAHADPLPYAEAFAIAGLELRKSERKYPTLGFFSERDAAGNLGVRTVEPGSTAASAGLQPNDVVVQWNGADPPRRLERWLRDQHAGDVLRLRVRREGREVDVQFPLGETTELFFQLAEDSHAGEKARRIREGWLHGTVDGTP